MGKIKIVAFVIAIIATLFITDYKSAKAAHVIDGKKLEHDSLDEQKPEEEMPQGVKMLATAYCINGTTATGTQTRVGIAAAKRSWFGKTISVYQLKDGKPSTLIGKYVVEDTGGDNIRNGKVLDIWMPTEDECFAFGRKSVYVVVEE